jgi:hypothetical protein
MTGGMDRAKFDSQRVRPADRKLEDSAIRSDEVYPR